MKSWKINDVYDIKWIRTRTDGGAFYMQPTYTCKYCGYSFDGHNECGEWSIDEKSPSEKNNNMAVKHILEHHILEHHREELKNENI